MKQKLLGVLFILCIGILLFGALTVSAGTYGDLTYKIYDGEVIITDCDSSATSVTIPDTIEEYPVTEIGEAAFEYCESLKSITISDSVTSIGQWAFCYCTGLKSITLPNSVTSIGEGSFYGCDSLTNITLPDRVTSIGEEAFYYCTGLTNICVSENNLSFCSEEGVLFNKDKTALLNYPSAKEGLAYSIPDSVTSIGEDAFFYCTGLISITIPDSVTGIGNNAFAFCDSLTSIAIPDSVTSIGYLAFRDCDSLTSVTIPDSVTSIGESAFYNCTGLKSVTLSNSVTSIGQNAFFYCRALTSITIPDSVTSIGESAFYNCDSLTSITIPDSVTSIGQDAFYWCDNLTIYCEKDSYALSYATKNNIPYTIVALGGPTVTVTGEAQRVNGKIVVFAESSKTVTTQCLHIALYNSNHAMIDYIIVPTVKPFDQTNVVFKDNKDASYAKIFLWDSLESLEPISQAYKVEIQ